MFLCAKIMNIIHINIINELHFFRIGKIFFKTVYKIPFPMHFFLFCQALLINAILLRMPDETM